MCAQFKIQLALLNKVSGEIDVQEVASVPRSEDVTPAIVRLLLDAEKHDRVVHQINVINDSTGDVQVYQYSWILQCRDLLGLIKD